MLFFTSFFSLATTSFISTLFIRKRSLKQRLNNASFLTILTQRSTCDHCRLKIPLRFLIPMLGFVLQKGKCCFCKKKINPNYFLSECFALLTAFILTLLLKDNFIILLLLIFIFNIIIVDDFFYYQFSSLSFLFLFILYFIAAFFSFFALQFTTAIINFSLMSALFLIFKNRLGFGDVMLSSLLALNFPLLYFPLYWLVSVHRLLFLASLFFIGDKKTKKNSF